MNKDPIARWYEDQAEEARRLRQLIKEAEAAKVHPAVLKRLKYKLELAEYVGD